MFCNDRRLVSPASFEDLEADSASHAALDDFKSAVIVAYEQAIEDGISSSVILTAMLDLAAVELKRCAHFGG
jgi:hypothetical protein